MKNLNVVIVGAGQAGAGLHLGAYRRCAAVTVSGICDPNMERARQVARDERVPGAYGSLSEALAASSVDVVSICTPPATHLPLAREALEAGCAVLVEKPMTVTLAEADELLAIQRETGAPLSVVHQNKFTPGIREITEIVRSGAAGDVLQLHLAWLSNGDLDRMTIDPNFWCHDIPGGRWAEALPHQLYIAYGLVGEMSLDHVQVRRRSDRWPWLPADEVLVTLSSRGGYVTIRMSANTEDKKRPLSLLHGTRRSYAFNYKMASPLPGGRASARERLSSAVREVSGAVTRRVRGESAAEPEPHVFVIRQFVQHVRDGSQPPTSLQEAHHVMKLTHEFGIGVQNAVNEAVPAA